MLRFLASALFATLLLIGGNARAEEKGPMGGPMAEVDPYHLELLVADGSVKVYVYDHHEKAVDAKAASAKATLLIDGKKQEIALAPAGKNLLEGKGEFKKTGKAIPVVIDFKNGKDAVQGRFSVK